MRGRSQCQKWKTPVRFGTSVLMCTIYWIQTTVLVQSFSNFSHELWMMRGGILCHGVKCQGQIWHFVNKTLWTQYKLQFLLNTGYNFCSITVKLHTSINYKCMMRRRTLYRLGNRVKSQVQIWHIVNKTLCTQYGLVFAKLLLRFWWLDEEPCWFWVTGSKSKVKVCKKKTSRVL